MPVHTGLRGLAFAPGRRSGSTRIIQNVAALNALFPGQAEQIACQCIMENYVKNYPSDGSPSVQMPQWQWNSYLCKQALGRNGGAPQFGNFYLGQPLTLNYLGRTEGMPGGSGAPPRNFFY